MVAIVDDHEVVLEGFKSYIQRSGITHVEAFSRVQPLLDRIPFHPFQVYIVDVELMDVDVSWLIDEIRRLDTNARIIINTMHEEMWVVSMMTEKKVDGVMYKSANLDQLLEAIKAVLNRLLAHNDILTKREQEILVAIAKGYSTKEISTRFYISENTVETHRQNIFLKLKAHNMADLMIKAIAAGYINPQEIAGAG